MKHLWEYHGIYGFNGIFDGKYDDDPEVEHRYENMPIEKWDSDIFQTYWASKSTRIFGKMSHFGEDIPSLQPELPA